MTISLFKPGFRLFFWGGAGLFLAAIVAYALWPKAIPVDMGDVTRGELVVEARAEGRTRVRELYLVSAPLAGRLQRIGNRAGESVEKGEVVAVLDPSESALLDPRSRAEAEAALKSATATLGFARAQLAEAEAIAAEASKVAVRTRTLFASEVVPQNAVDLAELELNAASARLAAARAAVTRAEADQDGALMRLDPPQVSGKAAKLKELRAPAAGKILRVHVQSEAVVAAGTPILEIGDPADIEIVAEFLSADAARFRPGAHVRITSWGGNDLVGRVRVVEPSGYLKVSALGVEEQRVNVIIDIVDALVDEGLGDGFRVAASVTVWSAPDTIQVPVSAMFRSSGAWSVFRIEDGRVRLIPVELGIQNQQRAQIVSGLSLGDRVVLYPDRSLQDGRSVRLRAD
jgi:HlyD family secretion protein